MSVTDADRDPVGGATLQRPTVAEGDSTSTQTTSAQTTSAQTEPPRRGLFLSFEGIDGSGKSTQARRLAEALETQGHSVVLTREPGGSTGAEEIRALVLQGDPDRWSPETEILLFTAARRDHLEKRILPALAEGKIVICDRFADSTRMYQGISRGDLRAVVDQLHALMIGLEPDATFIIDMDPLIGLSRAKGRRGAEERFEDFGADLQTKMRQGFLDLAADQPQRCQVVDGNRALDLVAAEVLARTAALLAPMQSQLTKTASASSDPAT